MALPSKAQKSSQPLLHVPLHSSGGCWKWEERTEWQLNSQKKDSAEGAQHSGCLRQALPNQAEDSRDTNSFQGLRGRVRKERAFQTRIGRLISALQPRTPWIPRPWCPEEGRASCERTLHQTSPEAAAGMGRLSRTQGQQGSKRAKIQQLQQSLQSILTA